VTVSVVVPWRPGCPWREASWQWVQDRYRTVHPDWEIVTGTCSAGPFNRAQAIIDGAERSSGDVLVVADSDVWCDPQPAIDHLDHWAIPHLLIHRLSEASTTQVLAGADWQGLPLSTDNRQDSRPYRGKETGTLVVLRRDVLLDVPPDRRFVGWGQEDLAWGAALNMLAGPPWRGDADLVHLWHPAQPRKSRAVGNDQSLALYRRYRTARSPEAMRQLIDEAREVACP
jgi:hypothetical protein